MEFQVYRWARRTQRTSTVGKQADAVGTEENITEFEEPRQRQLGG
jgi:hypothetical protein